MVKFHIPKQKIILKIEIKEKIEVFYTNIINRSDVLRQQSYTVTNQLKFIKMNEKENVNLTDADKLKKLQEMIKLNLYGNCNRNPKDLLFDILSLISDQDQNIIDQECKTLLYFLHHFFQDIEAMELNK